MYSASEWIFLDLWRFINVLISIIINLADFGNDRTPKCLWKAASGHVSLRYVRRLAVAASMLQIVYSIAPPRLAIVHRCTLGGIHLC